MEKFRSTSKCVIRLSMALLAVSALAQVSPETFSGLRWRPIGPFRGGRVVAVSGVAGDSTTFYFGGVNGGVWKTGDAGTVWAPIFDGQPIASIGAIAVAPSDPNTIYAGTGESDIRSDLSSGDGVYKSTDAGRTWAHVGLDDTRQISRIVVDPQNANTVYVGALGHAYGPNEARGVYKSTDGGTHWTKVLDQGPEIGISDLAICSSNPQILFAGTWHTHRPPWSTYAPIDGPGNGLFRSQDAGKNWMRIEGNGLPEGDWGRVGVDVSSNCKRVYALIPAKKAGLYRSDDAGNNWTLANADPRLTSRAWYFNSITIDPQNPDVIYIPNVALYRSEDGGKTIAIVRGAPGGDDYHQLWIDPKNSSSMVLGTDQGTTISLDRGTTWSTWYNQPTAQMYHVITDNQFPYVVYGTQQDSGSAAVPSRTDAGQITPRHWFTAGPSEAGYVAFDGSDPDIIYVSGTFGTVARFNRHVGFSQDITPWPAYAWDLPINQRKYRAPWSPVLVSSPSEPKALFFGTQYVLKTVDGGLHWQVISGDLTGSAGTLSKVQPEAPSNDEAKALGYGTISTIAPSPTTRDLIWAGSDSGLIHLTKDGGKSWKNVTPTGLSPWSRISLIEASRFDPAVAYVAVDRSRLQDQAPYIYRTQDSGATWKRINEGISPTAFVRAIREDPGLRGLLFAGTELGVYVSFDDGDHWQPLQLNLPVTSVRDLTVHGDDLIVATHGRSFWILDDITPLRQASAAAKAAGTFLYSPAPAVRIDNDSFVGTPLPPEEPTGENPPNGAIIDYFLSTAVSTITLEFSDAQGNVVRRFSSEDKVPRHAPLPVAERWLSKPEVLVKTPGMHRFVWNLTWGSSGGPVADEEADIRNPTGPKVAPGTYQVRLTLDGHSQTRSLKVIMDPRSPATPAVLAEQFRLGKQMFEETMNARRVMAEINSVRKRLGEALQDAAARQMEFKMQLSDAQSTLTQILTNKADPQPRSEGLQEAYRSIASALRVVESGDRTAPSQAIELYQAASKDLKQCMAQWSTFKDKTLPVINHQLQEANLAPINIAEIDEDSEILGTQ